MCNYCDFNGGRKIGSALLVRYGWMSEVTDNLDVDMRLISDFDDDRIDKIKTNRIQIRIDDMPIWSDPIKYCPMCGRKLEEV